MAKGASQRRLAAFEKRLGLLLPDDIRESYSLHNGTAGTIGLLYFGDVMSLEGIEARWNRYGMWQQDNGYGLGEGWRPDEIKGPIKPIWWSPLRIPVTDTPDPVMIDLDPGKGGVRGQVIKFSHEIGPTQVLAPSWSEWLKGIADQLEAGQFVYLEAERTVAPPGFYS
jgi:cell wall assembly regulator SMI1